MMADQSPKAFPAEGLRTTMKQRGLILAWFAMGSVPVLEAAARHDFDALVLDLQHGLWDRLSAHLAVSAVSPQPVIARVAANTAAAIGEALDSGAKGILVPLVETAEEARLAVAFAKYPTAGKRSGGGVRPLIDGFEAYFRENREPFIGVMIETDEGVRNAEEIAAVPGIDFVFLGTGDLALSIGCFPDLDERHEVACRTVFEICRSHDVACGIFTGSAQLARARLDQGYAAVVAANDIGVLVSGFAEASVIAHQKLGD
jgi:2-dehydro-3-deoxyglucarate aldolase/4-hydroxy-2-oxoheptanedioate aldolase